MKGFRLPCLTIPLQITRFGEPVAEVIPPSPASPADWIGSMKNQIKILGDIVSPASDESDWEALRD
jgi:hypothetical protein